DSPGQEAETLSHTGRPTQDIRDLSDNGTSIRQKGSGPVQKVDGPERISAEPINIPQKDVRPSIETISRSQEPSTGHHRDTGSVEPRGLISQVVRSAVLSFQRDGATITLRLAPPDLGALRMRLTSDGTAVSAVIAVERPDVKQAIETHLSQLRTTLTDYGVTIHSFTVSVGDDLRHYQERPGHPYLPQPHQSSSSFRQSGNERHEDRQPRRWLDDRLIDYFA
ncbi:MAG: flagellar hook-length control protein FliK, partial [Candidatus Latescibacteria bacterium]|nr:flagellar hook-length control protein FliK [Candidatus Latescibacterota bacterium]